MNDKHSLFLVATTESQLAERIYDAKTQNKTIQNKILFTLSPEYIWFRYFHKFYVDN